MSAVMMKRSDVAIRRVEVEAFTIPTDAPEADGTLGWESTTLVVVHAFGADERGLGYTYADVATATMIERLLRPVVEGGDALAPTGSWEAMVRAIRNLGRPGIASMAIAAVDCALWDLKARLLGIPLCTLLGELHTRVPVYGSGGFVSYNEARLSEQLAGWVGEGIPMVKMKIGTTPARDAERVRAARRAIGPDAQLFVDANGAYTETEAIRLAASFAVDAGVTWFEEPVSSDDLRGLAGVRLRAPAGMAIAAGEYGYDLPYFARMLEARAVDVLQADVSRCAGITELLRVDALARAHARPLSLHCCPSLHLHPALALSRLAHLEYFHDHVRIEQLLFDGAARAVDGALYPDLSRSGNGMEFKRSDAQRFAV